MAERNQNQGQEIEQIVARAVSQALQDQIPKLQEQIAQRVLEALPATESELPALRAKTLARWFMQSQAFMRAQRRKKFCEPCWMRAVSTVLASLYSW